MPTDFRTDSTAAAIWATWLADPKATMPLLALADRLDDLDMWVGYGYALRWAVSRGHRPIHRSVWPADSPRAFRRWSWEREGARDLSGGHFLPPLIYHRLVRPVRLRRSPPWLWYAADPWQCFSELAVAIALVSAVVEIKV